MCDEQVKPNTPDEMIAVIQAHKEGRPIQACWCRSPGEWCDITPVAFNFAEYRYRVKREPRKLYTVYDWETGLRRGVLGSITEASSYCARLKSDCNKHFHIVEFVENINE